jgi:two-component system sensor histidine kinase PilS (NtrC family)
MSTPAKTAVAGVQETFWRTLQTFNITRIVIAVMLLAYLSVNTKKGFWSVEVYQEICGIYLMLAVAFALLAAYYKRRFLLQVTSQIAADITVISLLYVAAGGAKSGLAILYLFPLAGGAILAPLLLALFFVSVATLVLLAESGYELLALTSDASISQAGLYGAAFFSAVYVINRLASKLISQEKLAAQRGLALKTQQAINRLVIADTGDGILVIGRDTTVFTCNPAAERMLGLVGGDDRARYKLTEIPFLIPIADAFHAWTIKHPDRLHETGPPVFVLIKPGEDIALQNSTTVSGARRELVAHLKLRFATVKATGLDEDRSIVFLQDVSDIENQAQQLKLASMGRLTASIAHEVRNPLAAISYAAALLSEETSNPAQSRLLNIVGDNVTRLNQMIEDILKLSRKTQSGGEPVLLAAMVGEILNEFQEAHGMKKGVVHLGKMEQYRISFDPLHLREVVVNLLSNAVRYASGREGSIRMHVVSGAANRLELHIQDDGPAITPEVRAHLFEPFYTTSNKGTGLGLYVARELCLNNSAMLDYEYRVDSHSSEEASGRFVITFAGPLLFTAHRTIL